MCVNGMLVEYDALHQAAIGVILLEIGEHTVLCRMSINVVLCMCTYCVCMLCTMYVSYHSLEIEALQNGMLVEDEGGLDCTPHH